MEKWDGRVAVVTGANSGIGAAITRHLLKLGLVVVGVDRSIDNLQILHSKTDYCGKLYPRMCDICDEDAILALFLWVEATLGGVDVLINNAGVSGNSSLIEGSPLEWRHLLNVNVVALSLCTREAIKSMRGRGVGDGHIIHMSSNVAHKVPTHAPFHFYSATKHCVKALTEGLRQELREINSTIRVSSISPGLVKSGIFRTSLGDEMEAVVYQNPYLEAHDIAATVEFILALPPHVQVQDVIIKPVGSVA